MPARSRLFVLGLGAAATAVAVAAAPGAALLAARQTWPPFALVAGLLLVGAAADGDGLFKTMGTRLAQAPASGLVLYAAALAAVAVVTAVLNLDTAVVFLTPVLLAAGRARGLDDAPFLYGAVAMCNASSLVLPGSNLTNLLVLSHERLSGAAFALRMAPASITAILVTAALLLLLFRSRLSGRPPRGHVSSQPLRLGPGLPAVAVAAVLVLVLRHPAAPVLLVGLVAAGVSLALRRVEGARLARALDAPLLIGVFLGAVALGTLAHVWGGPARMLRSASGWETAVIGAVASVALNNLPAAVLLGTRVPPHPRALLVGLNIGPNLAVTGALSALLWLTIGRASGARPSIRRYSLVGIVVAPAAIAAALLALWAFGSHGL
jgi:arsenical pump membrane protein